jgi:hypothetical protein
VKEEGRGIKEYEEGWGNRKFAWGGKKMSWRKSLEDEIGGTCRIHSLGVRWIQLARNNV